MKVTDWSSKSNCTTCDCLCSDKFSLKGTSLMVITMAQMPFMKTQLGKPPPSLPDICSYHNIWKQASRKVMAFPAQTSLWVNILPNLSRFSTHIKLLGKEPNWSASPHTENKEYHMKFSDNRFKTEPRNDLLTPHKVQLLLTENMVAAKTIHGLKSFSKYIHETRIHTTHHPHWDWESWPKE